MERSCLVNALRAKAPDRYPTKPCLPAHPELWRSVTDMTALVDLHQRIFTGEISAAEAVTASLEAIEAADSLRAFVTISADEALTFAAAADRAAARGNWLGPLHGVPFAVKDLQETAGTATSYGVAALRATTPDVDAVIVARLRAAGAIMVGKTNTPALGALGETKNRLGPPCRNPHDTSRTSGGSSGGSAAAVAGGLVPLATGTDSAGSIVCPAAFCGVVGMKPSRGRVPHWPTANDSLRLNHAGPIAGTASDIAATMPVIAGADPRDPDSAGWSADVTTLAPLSDHPLRGISAAFSPDLGYFAVDGDVANVVARAARYLVDLGATVDEACPDLEDPLEVYMPLYVNDFRRSLAEMEGAVADELYPETHREIDDFPPMAAEGYARALNRCGRMKAAVERFFERFDLLISPATACVAFPLDTPPTRIGSLPVPEGWKGFMPFQIPWNIAGNPSITVPCGTSGGMPVGMLLVGRLGDDANVLQAARAFEVTWSAERTIP